MMDDGGVEAEGAPEGPAFVGGGDRGGSVGVAPRLLVGLLQAGDQPVLGRGGGGGPRGGVRGQVRGRGAGHVGLAHRLGGRGLLMGSTGCYGCCGVTLHHVVPLGSAQHATTCILVVAILETHQRKIVKFRVATRRRRKHYWI